MTNPRQNTKTRIPLRLSRVLLHLPTYINYRIAEIGNTPYEELKRIGRKIIDHQALELLKEPWLCFYEDPRCV